MKHLIAILLSLISYNAFSEPTKASESAYNSDISKAYTSENLTNADIAWHALNTYGWNCEEVVSRGTPSKEGYYPVTCSSSGKKLHVYPRVGRHPKITNSEGTYKGELKW